MRATADGNLPATESPAPTDGDAVEAFSSRTRRRRSASKHSSKDGIDAVRANDAVDEHTRNVVIDGIRRALDREIAMNSDMIEIQDLAIPALIRPTLIAVGHTQFGLSD